MVIPSFVVYFEPFLRSGMADLIEACRACCHHLHDSSSGCTALHYAVDASQEETLQFAMDDGADIEAKDRQGWTPLMRGMVSESTISILQALVSRGADVNCCDRRNQTCLMQAVLSGRQDAVKLLIDAGVDLHSRNVYSNTALDMAIGRGYNPSAGGEPPGISRRFQEEE
uniref:(California timema) hypothetical protein n=2 Tax=Timema TaxID=61471 RepID=A0A7R9P9X9_TIMCA|nr:unnamed protein product [Timema californicum]